MIFKNGLVFVNGKFEPIDIRVQDGKISNLAVHIADDDEIINCENKIIIPGLFDIHTHGRGGYDFTASSAEDIAKLCRIYAESGVTSVIATTMTASEEQLKSAMLNIRAAKDNYANGANIRGINLEGPFLSKKKSGSHNENLLKNVDSKLMESFSGLSHNMISIVNIDPDLENAIDFIKNTSDKYIFSLAHTDCDYETAVRAYESGANHVTHLFNAMSTLHHRHPGLIGAVFDYPFYAEIICDLVHIHPSLIRLVFKAFPEKMILISDSIPPAGLSDGEYSFAGSEVFLKGNEIKSDGGMIVGSAITLFDALKNAINIGVAPEQAILSATYRPAKSLGLEKQTGSIAIGLGADLLVLDKQFNLNDVYIGGIHI